MLLRDAQEEVRVLCLALRNSARIEGEPLQVLAGELANTFHQLSQRKPSDWKDLIGNRDRTVGLMLLAALGAANELEVDSRDALKTVMYAAFP